LKLENRAQTIYFSFPEVARSGKEVVFIEGLSKQFGENILYDDLNLRALRHKRPPRTWVAGKTPI